MPSPWMQDEPEEERWSDHEAWRGDAHPESEDGWRTGETAPCAEEEEEAQREWPEGLAGPEYWLFKRDATDET